MDFSITVNSRDDFAAYLQRFIKTLLDAPLPRPPLVTANGHSNAGKSYIALLADAMIDPVRYPNGVTKEISADDALGSGATRPSRIAFINYNQIDPLERKDFRERLVLFRLSNHSAPILFASNIRIAANEITSRTKVDPDVDIEFKVLQRGPDTFNRSIKITVLNPDLHPFFETMAAESRLRQPGGGDGRLNPVVSPAL